MPAGGAWFGNCSPRACCLRSWAVQPACSSHGGGLGALTALLAGGRDHFTLNAGLNWTVLGVTALLSVATGLAFGLAPALQATRVDILSALKDVRANQPTSRTSRAGLGSLLVATQIALSLLLLVAAGLFGRTLVNLHAIEIGFNRDHVLIFTLRPYAVGYPRPALIELFEDLRGRLGHLPGVQSASLSGQPLPMGGGTMAPVTMDGVSHRSLRASPRLAPSPCSRRLVRISSGRCNSRSLPAANSRPPIASARRAPLSSTGNSRRCSASRIRLAARFQPELERTRVVSKSSAS